MRFALAAAAALIALSTNQALAWDGVNNETGDVVTVDDGTTFNEGDTLSMKDATGAQIDAVISTVEESDSGWTVTVTNDDGNNVVYSFDKPVK